MSEKGGGGGMNETALLKSTERQALSEGGCMKNAELQVFMFENQRIRITDRNGDPWFVAKDVCDILEIGNPTETMRNFPENERFALSSTEGKMLGFVHAVAGVNLINEPGLYRLVFQSRKPEAEAFKTWVFTEVLPSIRKKGFYAAPGKDREEQDEWKKNFPYPFLLLEDAAARMREMRHAMDKGTMTAKEWRKVVLGDFGPYKPDTDVNQFVNENLSITGMESDYVTVSDVYARYEKQAEIPYSRNALVRKIKNAFPGLTYKQKKLDGYPVLVFVGCRIKSQKAINHEKEAVNG